MTPWQLDTSAAQDLEGILAIEADSFAWPWGRMAFEGELSGNRAFSLVVRTDCGPKAAGVVAYIFFRFIAEEVHIYRLAVDADWRRRGIASQLVGACLKAAEAAGMQAALLEVRPSNTAAIHLYRTFGFRVIARRPGYYSDTREDAIILQKNLNSKLS
jgi:ribosomal-protein-alanine N-acetyltransferase